MYIDEKQRHTDGAREKNDTRTTIYGIMLKGYNILLLLYAAHTCEEKRNTSHRR